MSKLHCHKSLPCVCFKEKESHYISSLCGQELPPIVESETILVHVIKTTGLQACTFIFFDTQINSKL